MKLIKPNIKYKEMFLKVIDEYEKEEEWEYYYRYEEAKHDFLAFVNRLEDCGEGIGLQESEVAVRSFWLIDDRETEIRGIIRVRKECLQIHGNIGYDIVPNKRMKGYGKEILRLGIEEARKMGIEDLRVTCAEWNEGSKRIILENGGELLRMSIEDGEHYEEYIIKK